MANDTVPIRRRYACRACGRVHSSWVPRCLGCLAWEVQHVDGSEPAAPVGAPPRAPVRPDPAIEPEAHAAPVLRLVPPAIESEIASRESAVEVPFEDPLPPRTPAASAAGPASGLGPIPLSDVGETTFVRDETGLGPLDAVLGGGLVVASVVLLASQPGSGKSTLTLQMLAGLGHRCLYVTGEETIEQIAGTARRVGAATKKVYVIVERDLNKIFEYARSIRAQTIAIDSIQKMICPDLDGRAGSPGQVKECANRLVLYAKDTGTSLWIIGHVTGDGGVAGPRTIEHDVDVVLELEAGVGCGGNERILRCPTKNRFGATSVVGRFEIGAEGLRPLAPEDGDGWDKESF